ncbi:MULTISPECIES: sigma-70 family RNA polymerase sigma factor [unclassified Rhodococcus (in: high G+C Gram-positive bacteria)]|uniref:sigma-70 family RNA polymerase sigma factor n=1 Tax=unclassified Rhodococcus (in: high G+C Gram-positive bacteria) TaxID=192944 RepID=UPI0016394E4F|nr:MULTISPECIES: sigma-70 family RNA polymerase sigma factor [unclassified Rhodococcus (in: high G+C Gram-positive bacteria)]MBC2639773.1 sigma-70 family RNA polymerase sigma factor [Rhodococcus sp. 3A]MBC2895482.1 sigma-70 family RNA polymerase sigma factor [Rhodococcus sp. 4CII]
MPTATLVDEFESHRRHLLSVAYRLTGSVSDAEDAVQESWLRLDAAGAADIRDLGPWLTTVVGRICLDRLRSAAVRREQYVGQWLPEPIVTGVSPSAEPDPLEAVVREEDNRLAALIVLDTLTPQQRVAFVLHDGFGVPFDEVADILGIATPAARQLASRARKAAAATTPAVPDEEHALAVQRLLEALATGDLGAVVAALHPEAVVIGDANGTTSTAVNVVRGADKFARFFLGLLQRYGPGIFTTMQPVLVNGQLGVFTAGYTGDDAHRSSPPRVGGFTVRDGLVYAAYDIANPEKFNGIRLPDGPP